MFRQGIRSLLFPVFLVMAAILAASSNAAAQTHVVSAAELQQRAVEASRTRAANIQILTDVMASPQAGDALRVARMDPKQVQAAASTLGDEEMARLAARAAQAKRDFAAGDLSDRDLLIIIVGIAALILIIVAVR
jgi:Flp pilus assembly protein TadB